MHIVKIIFVLLFFITSCEAMNFSDRDANADATYRVTFVANWTKSRFSTNFPEGNDHFSGLVGATHNSRVNFWREGKQASKGIEIVAETGSKTTFINEIEIQKSNNVAEFLLSGGGLSFGKGNGNISFEFDINRPHPLVTLISMLAPSPDWFVGVHDLSLLNSRGQWVESLEVNLPLYDAGTDLGRVFTSADEDSNGVISLLTSRPGDTNFVNGKHRNNARYVGKFIFERIK
ncbi:MAG: hypothetical protein HAW63_03830 [Bdellovibrionaceae bacterium]|nr:hypothetical protein [Pseudobdellovibrionaceae bacterium]